MKRLAKNQAFLDAQMKAYEDARWDDEKRIAAMIAANTSDEEKAIAYAEARVIKVYLNWLANSSALALFEYVPLKNNQLPVLISETDQSYNVLEINQHGLPAADNFVNLDTVNQYLMYEIQTERIDYPVMSIQTGDLYVSDRVNERVGYNFDRYLNKDLWTLTDAAFDTYPSGTWAKDADIVANTLPSTNVISKTGEGAFTFECIKAMATHADQLGKTIKKIIINNTEKSDMYDWEQLVETSGTAAKSLVTKAIREAIVRDGTVNRFFGHDFEIVLDNTRAMKYIWFFMGPAGILFDKPKMAKIVRYSEKELRILRKTSGFEGVYMVRVVKPLIPAPYRLNIGRLQFDT